MKIIGEKVGGNEERGARISRGKWDEEAWKMRKHGVGK